MEDKWCKECNKAKKHFRIGDLIVPSVEGYKNFPKLIHNPVAVVVGFSRLTYCMRVLVSGRKNPQTFWCGFWERA